MLKESWMSHGLNRLTRLLSQGTLAGYLALAWACPAHAAGTPSDTIMSSLRDLKSRDHHHQKQNIERWHQILETSVDRRERMNAAIGLGLHYWSVNERLGLQYFNMAEKQSPDQVVSDSSLINIYKALARHDAGYTRYSIKRLQEVLDQDISPELLKVSMELLLDAAWTINDEKLYLQTWKKYSTRWAFHILDQKLVSRAANLKRKSGNKTGYFKLLERQAGDYPATGYSKKAFGKLLTHSRTTLPGGAKEYYFSVTFIRKLNRSSGLQEGLREELIGLLDHPVKWQGRIQHLKESQRVSALVRLREYRLAREQAEAIIARHGPDALITKRMETRLVRIHMRLDEYDAAEKLLKKYIALETHPGRLMQLLRLQARIYMHMGRHSEAAREFGRLALATGGKQDRWNQFWNTYQSGQYKQALQLLRQGSYVPDRDPRQKGFHLYWKTQVLKKMGRNTTAASLEQKLLNRHSQSYYASLIRSQAAAAKRIASNNCLVRCRAVRTVNPAPLPDFTDAKKPRLAVNSGTWGRYLLHQRKMLIPLGGESDTSRRWKRNYPIAFSDLIYPLTTAVGLDHYLLLSVMRAESYYNKEALSPVGARGLLQMMPYTALRISRLLDDPGFRVTHLSDPRVSIGYGSFYLQRLYKYYNGNFFLAVAAYNAGPTAVDRWLKNFNGSTEEFVETIPYKETRRYVKKVIGYYANYLKIHKNADSLPSIPAIPGILPDDLPVF